jgi:hypothetical protein
MNTEELGTWYADWMWSLPLIVVNVVIHIFGFALIYNKVVGALGSAMARLRFLSMFAAVMGVTVTLTTILRNSPVSYLQVTLVAAPATKQSPISSTC